MSEYLERSAVRTEPISLYCVVRGMSTSIALFYSCLSVLSHSGLVHLIIDVRGNDIPRVWIALGKSVQHVHVGLARLIGMRKRNVREACGDRCRQSMLTRNRSHELPKRCTRIP
jgi:hypothetical protein